MAKKRNMIIIILLIIGAVALCIYVTNAFQAFFGQTNSIRTG